MWSNRAETWGLLGSTQRDPLCVFPGNTGYSASSKYMKVYVSKIEGHRRGRSISSWKDMVKEYMHERSADRRWELEQARRESVDRDRWRLLCHGHPLGGHSQGKRGIRDYWQIESTNNYLLSSSWASMITLQDKGLPILLYYSLLTAHFQLLVNVYSLHQDGLSWKRREKQPTFVLCSTLPSGWV